MRQAVLPYTEAGVVESWLAVLRHLHAVGAPLRSADGAPYDRPHVPRKGTP